ncbi:MAG: anti-sigma factor [Hyphomicrobiales bacterium]|nr:anti-sigma factor [Hyphomicrobiales bacterium]
MSDRDEIDIIAAEYVLGTLDSAERSAASARRLQDPALDRAIQHWDHRMLPLLKHVQAVSPSADLFAKIEARIDLRAQFAKPVKHETPAANVVAMRRQIVRWRAATIGATAIAAALAGFIILASPTPTPTLTLDSNRFFAVFQENDQLPEFLLSINLETRELTIRPVNAPNMPDRTYQLWIVAEELGQSPRSLGLLNTVSTPTQKRLSEFDSSVLRGATFGISVEPKGGSPTGKPTGPALHGKLYPASL